MIQLPMLLRGRCVHCMAKIDEHRMIIVGGKDAKSCRPLSSGFIYSMRTQQSTHLINDMPAALKLCCVVSNEEYMFVIGGFRHSHVVNTVYRLCLETFQWTTMAPMGIARVRMATALKDKYIYVFGGCNDDDGELSSTERYSIDNNTWEDLADIPEERCCRHCAISTLGSEIYIVGGRRSISVDVFDTATLTWKTPTYLRHMPEVRQCAAAVVLKNKYLVVIGGLGAVNINTVTASCLIYDIWCNHWSSAPAFMDMIDARACHTAAVLDGKIVVAGGINQDRNVLASVECIDADALLEYAPLHYPLPTLLFDQILEIGKFELECVD